MLQPTSQRSDNPFMKQIAHENVSLAGWYGSQLTSLSLRCLNMNYLTHQAIVRLGKK